MHVRYNRFLGVVLASLGGLLSVGYTFVHSGNALNLVLSLVMPVSWLILGLIFLTQSYFIIDEHSLVLHPAFGPFKAQVTFQSMQDLSIEAHQLWVRQEQQWKRVPLHEWLVDKHDRKALVAFVQQRS